MASLIQNPMEASTTVFDFFTPGVRLGIASVLPILSYPFLPSVYSGSRGDPPGDCLFATSMVQVIFHSINAIYIALPTFPEYNPPGGQTGPKGYPVPSWALRLSVLSILTSLGLSKVIFSRTPMTREAQRDHFKTAAHWVMIMVLEALYRLLKARFFNGAEDSGYSFAMAAATTFHYSDDIVSTALDVLHPFALRRVHCWCWLPENGAKKDLDTWWSWMLFKGVLVGVPVLCFFSVFV